MGTRTTWPAALVALAVAAVLVTGLPSAGGRVAGAQASGGPDYAVEAGWVCRPDQRDACDGGLDATVVPADGRLTVEPWRPAPDPEVDCFFLYPTVSSDPGLNSDVDLSAGEEASITAQEAGRFGSACRLFAPAYRQVTVTSIVDGRSTDPAGAEVAYSDVVRAWRHYVAHDNGGRGFLLLGHSQGAGLAARLLREEVEPDPRLRERFVGAYLPSVGREFASPLCTRHRQVGCVVTWASYRRAVPPMDLLPPLLTSLFGRDPAGGTPFPCVNPATLLAPGIAPDATTWLAPAFPRVIPLGRYGAWQPPGPWVSPWAGTVATDFVRTPRFVEGRCVGRNGYHYLEVTVHGNPFDPRVDDIGGDMTPLYFGFVPVPRFVMGLHLADVFLVQGDLVRLAEIQVDAYTAARTGA